MSVITRSHITQLDFFNKIHATKYFRGAAMTEKYPPRVAFFLGSFGGDGKSIGVFAASLVS